MLAFGGIEVMKDPKLDQPEYRQNDPYGVDELSDVGAQLKQHDKDWTANKALKIVTPFCEFYPIDRPFKAIFMLRDQNEIITSLLAKRDVWAMDIQETNALARGYLEHRKIPTLFLWYPEALSYPKTTALRIQDFLEVEGLDLEKMSTAVDRGARAKQAISISKTILKLGKGAFDDKEILVGELPTISARGVV
jgi:hypothetical protein